MTTKYETHEHDVLIIGAGGAGLRAALEAMAQGAKVGVVCKSLLGKAHTVMAEGGIAAAMANVDTADDWQTHFRDTMRGGKFLNHWRMAQLHAQEAPQRVKELEQWGALFDRTKDGDILQRAFRRAHVQAPVPCWRPHRSGNDPHPTGPRRGARRGSFHGMHRRSAAHRRRARLAGAFAYWREQGRFVIFRARSVVLCTGGIGKTYKITSNSWEYTGDGMAMAYEAGAATLEGLGIRAIPSGRGWPICASRRARHFGYRSGAR